MTSGISSGRSSISLLNLQIVTAPLSRCLKRLFKLLYKTSQQLTREVYVVLLDQLCRTFEDVAKEAITWLIYADDEVVLFMDPFLFDLNMGCAAKIKRPCDRHTPSERSDQHSPARSATGQVLVC